MRRLAGVGWGLEIWAGSLSRVVHHANHYYGHSHVLARHCGLADDDPPRIRGYLQHGWNIGDGLAADHEFVDGTPVFLWSERTRRRAWSLGRRET